MIIPAFTLAALNDRWDSGALRVGARCWMVFQVTGTFSLTITFSGTVDGVTWVPVMVLRTLTGTEAVFTTVPNVVLMNATGFTQVRLQVTAYTSGAATVQPSIAYGG